MIYAVVKFFYYPKHTHAYVLAYLGAH